MPQPTILVIGSLNMDFVIPAPHIPVPGETIIGEGLFINPGGKGANQAFAAARLGGRVSMVGRVGKDWMGRQLRENLQAVGVDTKGIGEDEEEPTGTAFIVTGKGGENAIVVSPGANARLIPRHLESPRILSLFRQSRITLLQLEIPMQTVSAALQAARQQGSRTILDPAPARPLPAQLLQEVDILTPNETEACLLLGEEPREIQPREALDLARRLRLLGPNHVLLTMGEKGVVVAEKGAQPYQVPAIAVSPLDSTAAGDVFNGALAVALGEGKGLKEAVHFASAAAALSVTRRGAQASVPNRKEVDQLLKSQRN